MCIVEKAPNDALQTLDAGGVQWRAGVDFICCQLSLGAVGDEAMFVR